MLLIEKDADHQKGTKALLVRQALLLKLQTFFCIKLKVKELLGFNEQQLESLTLFAFPLFPYTLKSPRYLQTFLRQPLLTFLVIVRRLNFFGF
jgi:hypothetical protein